MPYRPSQLRAINLVVFNGYWYGLMLVAGGLLPPQISLGLLVYALIHLTITPYGLREQVLVAAHLTIGLLLESLWRYLGCFHYTQASLPLWVILMWLNFSLSICHSWWPLIRPRWMGALVGLSASLGPYLAANKVGLLELTWSKYIWVMLSWLVYGILASQSAQWAVTPLPINPLHRANHDQATDAKVQEELRALGFASQLEPTNYGEQINFVPYQDGKGRDVKVSLSYTRGLFEKVPALPSGKGRLIVIWQIVFNYPFKVGAKRQQEALQVLNSINPRLAMPGFYLQFEDSRICYNYCLIQQNSQVDYDLLLDAVGCALNQRDHFAAEFEALG